MTKILCGACQQAFEDKFFKKRLIRAYCPECGLLLCSTCLQTMPRKGFISKQAVCHRCKTPLVKILSKQAKQFQAELEQGRVPPLLASTLQPFAQTAPSAVQTPPSFPPVTSVKETIVEREVVLVICPFCNGKSPHGALYCQHCGAKL